MALPQASIEEIEQTKKDITQAWGEYNTHYQEYHLKAQHISHTDWQWLEHQKDISAGLYSKAFNLEDKLRNMERWHRGEYTPQELADHARQERTLAFDPESAPRTVADLF